MPSRSRTLGRHRAAEAGPPLNLPALFPPHMRRKLAQAVLSLVIVVTGMGFIIATAPNLFPQVSLDVPKQFGSEDLVEVGGPAADFALRDLRGNTVGLRGYRGRVVVLTFWAGWSPLAVEQLRTLERFQRRPEAKAVSILAVNSLEDESAVRSFARRGSFALPILLDEEGRVTEDYGLTTLPVTFFLDRKGRVAERVVGPMSLTQISNRAKTLSAGSGRGE